MIKSIINAKKIIEGQVKQKSYELISGDFSKYQKGFFWTNENINAYLHICDLSNKNNALTVAGSGDHIFNLITHGITEIDSFDINKLTEYFALGLKKAMILEYNYYEFLAMIQIISNPNTSLEELSNIIMGLLPKMDLKCRIFWNEIVSYNYALQQRMGTNLNLILLLYVGVFVNRTHLYNNTYLTDPYYYDELRSNLRRATITFKGTDAIDLAKAFKNKKYDLILLSNILDYAEVRLGKGWNYEDLQNYIKSLESICNEDAIIYLKYIIAFMSEEGRKPSIFHDSSIEFSEIQEKVYTIPRNDDSIISDGIILKRVKIDK